VRAQRLASTTTATTTTECVAAESGAVVSGYDVVAYFSLSEGDDGVPGYSAITSTFQVRLCCCFLMEKVFLI